MADTSDDHKREVELNEAMVDSTLRGLAANFFRIARGGGKLYEVEAQVMKLAALLAEHRKITSHGVSPHIFDEALSFDPEVSKEDKEVAEIQRVRSQIVRGALQLAASEILDQNTSKHMGEEELYEGQVRWEELRKNRNVRS